MKKLTVELFEKGDYVLVTAGYNKGKAGVVVSHRRFDEDVEYRIAGKTYEDDEDYDDDDIDSESSPTKFLKLITKTQYDTIIKKMKVISVPGLPVGVYFRGTDLVIGHNVITPTNAKMLADFILQNTKTKGKKK